MYDFLFPRSRTMPERLCNLINNPNKTNINSTLFAWLDTRQTRKKDSQLLLLINDENKVSEEALDAAHNYDVSIIKWSERNQEKNLSMLAS